MIGQIQKRQEVKSIDLPVLIGVIGNRHILLQLLFDFSNPGTFDHLDHGRPGPEFPVVDLKIAQGLDILQRQNDIGLNTGVHRKIFQHGLNHIVIICLPIAADRDLFSQGVSGAKIFPGDLPGDHHAADIVECTGVAGQEGEVEHLEKITVGEIERFVKHLIFILHDPAGHRIAADAFDPGNILPDCLRYRHRRQRPVLPLAVLDLVTVHQVDLPGPGMKIVKTGAELIVYVCDHTTSDGDTQPDHIDQRIHLIPVEITKSDGKIIPDHRRPFLNYPANIFSIGVQTGIGLICYISPMLWLSVASCLCTLWLSDK